MDSLSRKAIKVIIGNLLIKMKLTNTSSIRAPRQSNFEALRLLSMLMVLNLHSFYGFEHGEGVLQALDIFRNSTSICAVNAFILISGYFGIKWKPKSFFNLVFQILFYSFAVYFFVVAVGILPFEKGMFLSCFKGLFASWGFIKNYLLLYFFSPMLNALADRLNGKNLLVFILIFYLAENFVFISMSLMNFVILYLLGRFINKTDAIAELKVNANVAYWLFTIVIFIFAYIFYLSFHYGAEFMSEFILVYSYASPFVILQALFLFLVFGRFKFQNKIVNWCSASCLAIFLIHTHPAIKNLEGIGYYNFTESLYNRSILEHVIILLFLMLIVFFGSILIDKVRIALSDIIYKVLVYIYFKIPRKYVSLDTYLPQRVLDLI